MAIYNGPARGGTRGGKDQFNWEDVKEDKQGQNYLGHSVKAAHGRWQKNKDLNWAWSRSKLDLQAANKSELQLAKERDADLMAQMLGEKPMQRPEAALDRREKNKLFKKGDAEEGTVAEGIAGEKFGERIEGLGFAPIKVDNLREMMDNTTHERQEGVDDLLKAHAAAGGEMEEVPGAGDGGDDGIDYAALLANIEGSGGVDDERGGASAVKMDKKARKEMKKALKADKKRLKAEKKEGKKDKKEKKERKSKDAGSMPDGGAKRHDSSDSSDANEAMKPREYEREQRHREWARGGERVGVERVRSRSRSRERSRERMRDRRSRSRSHDGDRERGRERDRDRRDRDRSRDRGKDSRHRARNRSESRDRHG